MQLPRASDYNPWQRPCKLGMLLEVAQAQMVAPQPVPGMDPPQHDPRCLGIPASVPAGSGSSGLLLSRDLIFTTKIKATAAQLGYQIQVASDVVFAESRIRSQQPRVLLIDLTAGDLCAPSALRTYRKLAGPDTWFVAFGPHVDAGVLAAAKAAGCQTVMPRSKFSSELPELIRRWFSPLRSETGEAGSG